MESSKPTLRISKVILFLLFTKIIFCESNDCEIELGCVCENSRKGEVLENGETKLEYTKAICTKIPTLVPISIISLKITGKINKIRKSSFAGLTHLITIDLNGCQVGRIENEAFIELNDLEVLNLSNNNLEEIENSTFGNVPSLQELYLNNNSLKNIHDGAFGLLQNLSILHLQNNKLLDVPFGLPSLLQELDVSNNNISKMALNVKNLETLSLCGNPMNVPPDSIYQQVRLNKLCLGNNLTDVTANRAFWSKMINLTFSASDQNEDVTMTNTMKTALGQMEHLLYLKIENYVLDTLNFLTNMANIQSLEMKKIILTRIPESSFMKNKNKLHNLILDESPDIAQKILLAPNYSINIPTLYTLSLKDTNIRKIKFHASYHILKNLKELDLRDNPLECDPIEWQWLSTKADNTDFLINQKEVICQSPENVKNMPILESLKSLSLENRSEQYAAHNSTSEQDADINLTEVIHKSKNQSSTAYTVVGTVFSLVILGLLLFALYRQYKKQRNAGLDESENKNEVPLEQTSKCSEGRFTDTKVLSS